MGALVFLLVVTNLATLGVLGWVLIKPADEDVDPVVAAVIESAPAPAGQERTRRVITMEILNAVEVAQSRGRVAGIAGSLAPGLVRWAVVDQAMRQMKRDLKVNGVVAEVRLHTIRPGAAPGAVPDPRSVQQEFVGTPLTDEPVHFAEIRRLP